jgi:hypothetical protein
MTDPDESREARSLREAKRRNRITSIMVADLLAAIDSLDEDVATLTVPGPVVVSMLHVALGCLAGGRLGDAELDGMFSSAYRDAIRQIQEETV